MLPQHVAAGQLFVADGCGGWSDTTAGAWQGWQSNCSCMGTQLRERWSEGARRPGRWSAASELALQRGGTFALSLGAGDPVVSDDAFPNLRSMLYPMLLSHGSVSLLPVERAEICFGGGAGCVTGTVGAARSRAVCYLRALVVSTSERASERAPTARRAEKKWNVPLF